ncbi:MAG: leucine-rich repeat domain-containing protein, partial [bacterium]|nr:leucine-rich repeat domain-containing protein [bacterium]
MEASGTMANDMELLKQLEKAIGNKLEQRQPDKIAGTITNGYAQDEREQVTGLNLAQFKLDAEVLKCLSHFGNLEILSVYKTGLKTLSPLQGLTNLTQLSCSSNQVSDLSPLKGLTKLTELDFNRT